MPTYDKPMYQTIVAAGNAAISTTADIFQFQSPAPGLQGRVVGVSAVTKVATTGQAGLLQFGIPGNTDLYGTLTIPVTLIDTAIQFTQAELDVIENLPADTVITVDGNGGCDAGSLDLAITIGWFK